MELTSFSGIRGGLRRQGKQWLMDSETSDIKTCLASVHWLLAGTQDDVGTGF